jgi:hypothetical protein
VIAWCYFARALRVCRYNEEALFSDAGSRRRIQVDRRLQHLPATSPETEGRHGVFWDKDDEIGIGQASIAVVTSAHLWLAFWAAICFRGVLAIFFNHLVNVSPSVITLAASLCIPESRTLWELDWSIATARCRKAFLLGGGKVLVNGGHLRSRTSAKWTSMALSDMPAALRVEYCSWWKKLRVFSILTLSAPEADHG